MRTAFFCFAIALSIAPQLAVAAGQDSAGGGRLGEAPHGINQTRFDLVSGPRPDMNVDTGLVLHKFSPESRGSREAEGARFGDGEVQYIEGPSWDYHTSRRGPMFEVGALGGGIENAPYLAHVAVDWRF